MRIGIIGGGRLGQCLAKSLRQAGLLCGLTASTAAGSAALALRFGTAPATNAGLLQEAELLLLTVPDRLIGAIAAELAQSAAGSSLEGKCVLHCSGSLGLEPLAPLAALGAHAGSLHPLQSFAGGATELAGVYMAIDGDVQAQAAARELAAVLGGRPFYVPAAERAAYHAAACICSNYAVAVEYLAQQLMRRWTGSAESAWQALLPLFRGTAANLEKAAAAEQALTGPIARGDGSTVAAHLAALPQELQEIYRLLGLTAAEMALANGTIDGTLAGELQRLLRQSEVKHDA